MQGSLLMTTPLQLCTLNTMGLNDTTKREQLMCNVDEKQII